MPHFTISLADTLLREPGANLGATVRTYSCRHENTFAGSHTSLSDKYLQSGFCSLAVRSVVVGPERSSELFESTPPGSALFFFQHVSRT